MGKRAIVVMSEGGDSDGVGVDKQAKQDGRVIVLINV